MKLPADRLYGRVRGHTLRPRQQLLLEQALPRLRYEPGFLDGFARLALEVGFGGGEHAAALIGDAGLGLIACEVFEPGICSLLSRLVPEGADAASADLPGNLQIWDDDARLLMRELPAAAFELVALLFPDPWPKARHARRRFVHPAQVALVARLLRPGGVWRVASDDPTYQAWVEEVMGAQTLFLPAVACSVRPAGWPATRYEAKALRAGRKPLYWLFVRTAEPLDGAEESGCRTPSREREGVRAAR